MQQVKEQGVNMEQMSEGASLHMSELSWPSVSATACVCWTSRRQSVGLEIVRNAFLHGGLVGIF